MTRSQPDVVRISSPSDVVAAVAQLLGFVPTESIAALCLHGPRRQLGLAMRFDLELADDVEALRGVDRRPRAPRGADGVLFVVFTAPRRASEDCHTAISSTGCRMSSATCWSTPSWWRVTGSGPTCATTRAAARPTASASTRSHPAR